MGFIASHSHVHMNIIPQTSAHNGLFVVGLLTSLYKGDRGQGAGGRGWCSSLNLSSLQKYYVHSLLADADVRTEQR